MCALYADKWGNGFFLGSFGANCCLFRLTQYRKNTKDGSQPIKRRVWNLNLKALLGERILGNLARFSPCSNRYLVAGEMHPSFQAWPRADPKQCNNQELFNNYYSKGQFRKKKRRGRCWWRMLETKCVGDKLVMLMTDSGCWWPI